MNPCPPREKLKLFVMQELCAEDSSELESHAASCESCQLMLEAIQDEYLAQLPPFVPLHPNSIGSTRSLDTTRLSIPDYTIVEELSRGGMGVVYKARQVGLNRLVALKMILSGSNAGPEDIARFRLEAESVARLQHPNIVQIYDIGEHEGRPFFSLELVDGASLDKKLSGAPLPPCKAAALVEKLARAMHAAHEKGIVHRDLKPANVLLAADGTPKITDFGLAKRLGDDSGRTATGAILGTPSYMAPEQAEGRVKEIGPVTDVYALGAILYECLTGRPPFKAATAPDTVMLVLSQDPVSVRQLQPHMPRDLETICHKCLQKESRKRYGSAGALADDLVAFLDGRPIAARPASRVEKAWRSCRRHPAVAGLTAAVALAFLLGTGISFYFGVTANVALSKEEQARKERARALINALRNATPQAVPGILEALQDARADVEPRLQELWGKPDLPAEHRIRVSLALLPWDTTPLPSLRKAILEIEEPAELLLVCESLRPHAVECRADLWGFVDKNGGSKKQRFRALSALASFDPDNPRWEKTGPQVIEQLLTANALHLAVWTAALRPVRPSLLTPLSEACRTSDQPTTRHVAATILADYAANQPAILAEALVEADAACFAILHPKLAVHTVQAVPLLEAELARRLPANTPDADHDLLAKRQANAAVALLKLNQAENVWRHLKHSSDSSLRSYLIHRFAALGVDPRVLVNQFGKEEDVSARRALVLALGEYSSLHFGESVVSDGLSDVRGALIPQLLDLYRKHPDPGTHAATAWTLLQYGQEKKLAAIDRELAAWALPLAQLDTKKSWFINSQGQTFTIVSGPVEFLMGSPQSEPRREPDELPHRRSIGHRFAIAAHPVTVDQFKRFNRDFTNHEQHRAPTLDCPVLGVTWYEAVEYCNWLSQQEGIPKDQWCYLPNKDGKFKEGMRLAPDYLQRIGYRLPTEDEWEYCCRAGSTTARYFGRMEELLPKYARYIYNADERSWSVGRLKPNDLGLFDMHGNVWNWCSDKYTSYQLQSHHVLGASAVAESATPTIDAQHWTGIFPLLTNLLSRDTMIQFGPVCQEFRSQAVVTERENRIARGGGFSTRPALLRSADREMEPPSKLHHHFGFRVARTLKP